MRESRREGREKAKLMIAIFRSLRRNLAAILAGLAALAAAWQAYEARRAATTASEALHVSERAYVSVGAITIFCPLCDHPQDIRPPGKFPAEATAAFLINVVNEGRTPAYHVEMNVSRYSEVGHRLPVDYDFAEDPRADVSTSYLPPNPNNPLQIKLPARAEEILSAQAQIPLQHSEGQTSSEYLYIYGHVTYTDVFQRHHVLLFCREYTGPTEAIPEHWSRCSTHEGEVDRLVPKKMPQSPGFALPQFYPPEPPDNRPPGLRQIPRHP